MIEMKATVSMVSHTITEGFDELEDGVTTVRASFENTPGSKSTLLRTDDRFAAYFKKIPLIFSYNGPPKHKAGEKLTLTISSATDEVKEFQQVNYEDCSRRTCPCGSSVTWSTSVGDLALWMEHHGEHVNSTEINVTMKSMEKGQVK